ncbi:MAG: (Fe-S)-binding protein [Verrucomicrobia bacterium]|nr:(Fe-S)-binding protein [Verrucomicrobiota bacterium]
MKINLLIPCFVDQLFPSVGISVVRIFEKLGHTVDFKQNILCCGQPAFNAGFWDESREIAVRIDYRSEPNWRYRTDPGSRRARPS